MQTAWMYVYISQMGLSKDRVLLHPNVDRFIIQKMQTLGLSYDIGLKPNIILLVIYCVYLVGSSFFAVPKFSLVGYIGSPMLLDKILHEGQDP